MGYVTRACMAYCNGAELHYWQNRLAGLHPGWSEGQILNMSVNYTRNLDVDGDNITHGKEIKGYEVKIIISWKSDETSVHDMIDNSPLPFNYFEEILSTAILFYAFFSLLGV